MVTPVKRLPIHLQSAQNRILVKGGKVVNEDGVQQVDIYIEDRYIKQMGNHLIIPGGTRVIDASGKFVVPGGIDLNVHLQAPTKTPNGKGTVSIDNFYHGTKAAIAGGTTMVVDTAFPEDGETLEEALDKWKGWAEDLACCDFALKVAVPLGGDVNDDLLGQMELLATEDRGVNTFHLQMAPPSAMLRVFEKCVALGCVAQVHAVSGEIVERNVKRLLEKGVRGPEGLAMAHSEASEEEAVMRAATLANQAGGCPVQINHCMSARAAETIAFKKGRGNVVFGEVTPAALACDGKEYWNRCWRHAAGFTCAPPIRRDQREKLLLEMDSAFDVVSSHHRTYSAKQKAFGLDDFSKIPLGVNGVESRMSVLWEAAVRPGKITPERFVAMTSSVPAKLINVFPDKGRLAVGSQADVVVWDPNASRTISARDHSLKADFNVFEGMTVHGVPETVIVQGKVVVDEGRVRVMQGAGRFVPLRPFAPFVYERVRAKKKAEDFDLAGAQGVARSEEDMEIPSKAAAANGTSENGDHDRDDDVDVPPPTPKKTDQPERAPSQHVSHFEVGGSEDGAASAAGDDELDDSSRGTPRSAPVRVRAPPGGKCSGSFW